MGETFYSVLGVASDADTETIRDAYRAQVKETHPDVSDDDDAADTFKRLTAARDVLVDETARRRYDRVGHTAYVRDHLDSSAWSLDESDPSGRSTGTGATGSADETGANGDSTDRTRASDRRDPGDDSNAENYQRYRSSHAETGTSGRDRSGRTGRRHQTGRTDRTTGTDASATGTGSADTDGTEAGGSHGADAAGGDRANTGRTDGEDAGSSGTDTDGADAAGTDPDEYGTWSTDAGQDWAFSGSSSASTATGGHSVDPRDRARADGWQAAHAATNAYTPSGHEPTAAATDGIGVGSLRNVLRQIGPWLAFHFVFLISAFVTVWFIMTWIPSVPMLFVSLLLLGATVFFSILHMVSQVYS